MRYLLLLLGMLMWGAVHAAPTIAVLGDSLSAAYGIDEDSGWVALLRDRLQREGFPHRVVNASISGDTTRGGRERLPGVLERHDPAILIVELGGNDGLRALPIAEIRRNLAAIIETAQARGVKVLLLGMHIPPNYGPAYTGAFHNLYGGLAEEYGVALVPFFLDGVGAEAALMQDDGLHPEAAAQPRLLENVWPRLEPMLRD